MTQTQTGPQLKHRKDYREPDFWIDTADLDFDLGEKGTVVINRMTLRRNGNHDRPLVLHGEELETLGVDVDGKEWPKDRIQESGEELSISGLPANCVLTITVRNHPETNTALNGLYRSSGNFSTQCEAEGFRRITWFLDRPDVMAKYTTTITADKAKYPVMLSNGNKVSYAEIEGGRHRVKWEDPFKKPCYLFAPGGGQLEVPRWKFHHPKRAQGGLGNLG